MIMIVMHSSAKITKGKRKKRKVHSEVMKSAKTDKTKAAINSEDEDDNNKQEPKTSTTKAKGQKGEGNYISTIYFWHTYGTAQR